jgi:tetraacyldisaccharide 4'-kinase
MRVLELAYYLGLRARTSYDAWRARKLPVPVISIGNITTGGTGKTPATAALAAEAQRRGRRPCVLTRGYRGRLKGPALVSPDMEEAQAGDEALLLAEKLVGVPVVKGKDRYASGMYALTSAPRPDLFILDDGFQHRRLVRDVDVLLINAASPFDNGRLLPVGHLREPLPAMKRAHAIVLTRSDCVSEDAIDGLTRAVRRHNAHAPVFRAVHGPSFVRTLEGERRPLTWLRGRRLYAFSGIAGGSSFEETLRKAGAEVAGGRVFGDHHRYGEGEVRGLSGAARECGASWIITTEKDIMRLRGMARLPENLIALGIEFVVPREFYEYVLSPERLA